MDADNPLVVSGDLVFRLAGVPYVAESSQANLTPLLVEWSASAVGLQVVFIPVFVAGRWVFL